MNKIKIGLVGLGWVGLNRHVPAIRRTGMFEIVGVADRNESLAKDWASRLNIPFWSKADKVSELSWIDKVDAIDVATAPEAHFDLVRDSLLAGKHVITEKPFTLATSQGEALLELANKQDRRIAVVHNFQFASSAKKAMAALNEGRLGNVKAINATQWGNPSRRLPSWYDSLPGGLFFDESPHLLYLIRCFSPGALKLLSVVGFKSTLGKKTPSSVDVFYECAVGDLNIPVSVSCRFESPVSEWQVAILGTKAVAIVDVFRDIYIEIPNDGEHATLDVLRTSLVATWKHWASHLINGPLHLTGRLLYGNDEVFSRFALAIHSGVDPVGISGKDALEVLSMQVDVVERLIGATNEI